MDFEFKSASDAVPVPQAEAQKPSASDTAPTEDLALALLKRNDLPPEALEQLSKNSGITKSHKVKLAIAAHPRTSRHVSLPLLRQLFTFELMNVALTPAAPADIRVAAEEALVQRLEAISWGEKLSLARRASGRVAAALLLDPEPRVMQTALENSRLTEASIVKAVLHRDALAVFIQAVCRHPKWSLRREVRIALLRNENIPLALALEFARALPLVLVTEILRASKLPENAKAALGEEVEDRNSPRP